MTDKELMASVSSGIQVAVDRLQDVARALEMMGFNNAAQEMRREMAYLLRLSNLLNEHLLKAKK